MLNINGIQWHLSSINSKLSRALFTIKQVKFSLPQESLHTLYFSLLQPHLTYGILVWGNAKSCFLHKTEVLQKRALRIINCKKFNSHTDPLFKQSGILKLSDLYQLQVLLFMHKYSRDKLPMSFRNIFTLNRDINVVHETRQVNMFHVAKSKCKFIDKLPLYQFPLLWNEWYPKLNINLTYSSFKRSIKTMCLGRYAAMVNCSNPYCNDCHN